MALTVSRKAPTVKPLQPRTRLTLTFRELQIEGKRTWRHVFVFAQFAADEGSTDCRKVIEIYKALPRKEQRSATPEHVCELAAVDSTDFAAEVFRAYLKYSGDAAHIIAAAGLPGVVKKSIQVARTDEGWRDRKMQLEHAAFLPVKQAGNIHVEANASSEHKSILVQAPELPSMGSDTMRYTRLIKDGGQDSASDIPVLAPVRALDVQSDEE